MHAALGQDAFELPPRPGVVGGQDRGSRAEHVQVRTELRAAGGVQAAEAVLHGERDFHAAGSGADDGDAGRLAESPDAVQECVPPGQEIADGLDRNRVPLRSRHLLHVGRRADVQGRQVVTDRRPIPEEDFPPIRVQLDDFVVDQAGRGEDRQLAQVDMRFVVRVVPGDEARQHPGVGRMDIAADQGQLDAGNRLHAEALEDGDVAMPPADQHKVLDDRRRQDMHAASGGGNPYSDTPRGRRSRDRPPWAGGPEAGLAPAPRAAGCLSDRCGTETQANPPG